jgi:hypothetical protein
VVRETTEQVIERVRDFRRSVLIADPNPASPSGMRANAADVASAAPATGAEGPQRG